MSRKLIRENLLDYSQDKLINTVLEQQDTIRELRNSSRYKVYIDLCESIMQEKRFREKLEDQILPLLKRLKQYQLLVGDIDVEEFYKL